MGPTERKILEKYCRDFEKENPPWTIHTNYKETEELRSSFLTASFAGVGPELVYGPSDQVGPFYLMDLIRPIESYFNKEYLSDFKEKGLVHFKGHLLMISDKIGNHLCLLYNRKYIKLPPKTFDELIKISQEFQKERNKGNDRVYYGIVWNYTEPFFYIPFLSGFGGWVMDKEYKPTLDTNANINALKFILKLRDKDKVIPKECDYNIADTLFKEGKAMFLINGPWSFGDYKKSGLDFGVAPIPKINETGLMPAPMVSARGYSINKLIDPRKLDITIKLLKFLTSKKIELEYAEKLGQIPSRRSVSNNPELLKNPIFVGSMEQIKYGKPMPIVPEMRAIWDAMRPEYQAVLGGSETPEEAAKRMQKNSIKKIGELYE